MKLSITVAVAAVALSAFACTPRAKLNVPDGFAELDRNDSYAYRAATAQGIVVAVRTEKNAPRANVDFWSDAIDLRMRRVGYRAVAAKNVKSQSGLDGKQIRYARENDGRTYRYWITVFVQDDKVIVVEAGGDQEAFDPAEKTVEQTVLTIHA